LGVVFQVFPVLQDVFVVQVFAPKDPPRRPVPKPLINEVNSIAERVNRFMGEVCLRGIGLVRRSAQNEIASRALGCGHTELPRNYGVAGVVRVKRSGLL
jgi:hypothetical protein